MPLLFIKKLNPDTFFFQLLDYFPGLILTPVIGITLGYISERVKNKYYKLCSSALAFLLSICFIFKNMARLYDLQSFGTGETWKEVPQFTFYKENIPMRKDSVGTESLYLSQYGIHLTFLKVSKIVDRYQTLGQAPIPLTIILNPEGKIVYWGNVDKIRATLTKYK